MDVKKLIRMRQMATDGTARAIRQAAGLSLSEAGGAAGVNRVTVHRWETNQRRPHGEAALRYLRLLERLAEND